MEISPCFSRIKLNGYASCISLDNLIDIDINNHLSPITSKSELATVEKLALFKDSLNILSDFIRIYSDLPSWIEIATPLQSFLSGIRPKNKSVQVYELLIKENRKSCILYETSLIRQFQVLNSNVLHWSF